MHKLRFHKPSSEEQAPADPWDLLEAYVDGELGDEDRRALEAAVARDPDLAREVALARRVREGLRSLPGRRCPEAVTREVRRRTTERPSRWRLPRLHAGWGVAIPALLLLAVVSRRAPLDVEPVPAAGNRPVVESLSPTPDPSSPSAEEVARAEADVKLAFAYLGKLGRTAGDSVLHIASASAEAEDDGKSRP